MYVELPADFLPTHLTAGLPGYPAIDIFGEPGSEVVSSFYGRVRRVSGRDCSAGGPPGGAYGRSVYLLNHANGWERYLTHLDELRVRLGDRVGPGSVIGTLCDAALAGKPHTTHCHMGLNRSALTRRD